MWKLYVRDLLAVFSPSLPGGTGVSDGFAVAVFREADSAYVEGGAMTLFGESVDGLLARGLLEVLV